MNSERVLPGGDVNLTMAYSKPQIDCIEKNDMFQYFSNNLKIYFSNPKAVKLWGGQTWKQLLWIITDYLQYCDFATDYNIFWVCSQLEIDDKYQNQICGLCGDFDGVANELVKDGKILFSFMER